MLEMNTVYVGQNTTTEGGNSSSTPAYFPKLKQYIRPFSASPKDREIIDDWINEFESKAQQLYWPDEDKRKHLGNFLTDCARDWYDINADPRVSTAPSSWSELKELFLKRFRIANLSSHYMSQIREAKQRPDEPACSFLERMNKMCNRINMPIDLRIDLIKDKFHPWISAAINQSINHRECKGEVISTMLEFAQTVDACSKRNYANNVSSALVVPVNTSAESLSSQTIKNSNKQSDFAILLERMDKIQNELNALKEREKVKYNRNRTNIRCSYSKCGRWGHTIERCRAYQRDNNTANANPGGSGAAVQSTAVPLTMENPSTSNRNTANANCVNAQVKPKTLTWEIGQLVQTTVLFNGIPIESVIDVGAMITIIDFETYHKLKVPLLPYTGPKVSTPSSNALPALGQCEVVLTFQDDKKSSSICLMVMVVDSLGGSISALIGQNANSAAKLWANTWQKTIHLDPLIDAVQAAEDLFVPERSRCMIAIIPARKLRIKSGEYMIETPANWHQKSRICLANSLIEYKVLSTQKFAILVPKDKPLKKEPFLEFLKK